MSKKRKNKYRRPAIICPFCADDPVVKNTLEEPGRLLFCKRYFGEKYYPVVRDNAAVVPDKSQLVQEEQHVNFIIQCSRCGFKTFASDEPEAYKALADLGDLAKISAQLDHEANHENQEAQITLPFAQKKGKVQSLCLIRRERNSDVSELPY